MTAPSNSTPDDLASSADPYLAWLAECQTYAMAAARTAKAAGQDARGWVAQARRVAREWRRYDDVRRWVPPF